MAAFWTLAGWRGSGPEILDALRSLYSYTGREPDRATGWLYSARQIGQLPPTPWPAVLAELGPWMLNDLAAVTGTSFDAACFQAYLDGAGVGWHHDRDWGAQAVLSLGVTRSFGVRRTGSDAAEFVRLGHGDLLVMPAGFQDLYEHCVPVEDAAGERCSIVFRSAALG